MSAEERDEAGAGDARADPVSQEDLVTLEAELREAMQHRHAALERVREAQAEMEALLARARALLEKEPPAGR